MSIHQTNANSPKVQGKLVEWKRNKHNDVDGFYLENETGRSEVRFPPHMGAQVTAALSIGVAVQVAGEIQWRADLITNTANGQTVQIQPPHATPETVTYEGKITDWKHNKHHDVDGFYLDSATGRLEVHFPPHMGGEVTTTVAIGTPVSVIGALHRRPHGNVLQAETLTNTTKQKVVMFKPPHKSPKATLLLEGKVVDWKRNHHNDLDGLYVEKADAKRVEVRFPPHIGKQVGALIAIGDAVRVAGELHADKKHDPHVRAATLTNTQTEQKVSVAP